MRNRIEHMIGGGLLSGSLIKYERRQGTKTCFLKTSERRSEV